MIESEFWKIVDDVHLNSSGDMEKKCDLLKITLSTLSKDEATQFLNIFNSMMDKAYCWDLWGAAYVMNGGCSDDSFTDFRASLISRGNIAFKNAFSNPDSLADEAFDEELFFYEGYQYAIADGVKAVFGTSPSRENPAPDEPSGLEWDEDDTESLKNRYPGLWAKAESRNIHNIPLPKNKPWWKFW